MGLIEWLTGWKKIERVPRWIERTSKMKRAHYFATHKQIPGTTVTYHLKGKRNVYRIKVKSTGQYAIHTIYAKEVKKSKFYQFILS